MPHDPKYLFEMSLDREFLCVNGEKFPADGATKAVIIIKPDGVRISLEVHRCTEPCDFVVESLEEKKRVAVAMVEAR